MLHVIEAQVSARDLLREDHPWFTTFHAFTMSKDTPITLRQARKFLQRFPQFKVVRCFSIDGEKSGYAT